ncbi:phosphatidylinositol mannoside acyltransferase [Jatrophihabitans sp. YIM 134969]
MSSTTDRLTDTAYAAGWWGVRALPEGLARASFARGADLGVRRGGKGVDRLRRNLRRVLLHTRGSDEGLDHLVQAGMRSYSRYWRETFRLPGMDKPAVARDAGRGMEGIEHIDAAMVRGKGLILALPHSGNWEVAAVWLVAHGVPFTTVAERLKPESLFDRFVAYRESLGMEVLALSGGAQPPAAVLAERLEAGRAICLLGDRDMSRHGVPVEFFGAAATMPPGPALLAAQTGATLLPVHVSFTGTGTRDEGWRQWVGPPVELGEGTLTERIARGTQTLATAFEARIGRWPEDWHMLATLWSEDRSSRPKLGS